MKTKKYILIDTINEWEDIQKSPFFEEDAALILLSSSFHPQILNNLRSREMHFFDDRIPFEKGEYFSSKINHTLWNWFLDENNTDLSLINGCSLGKTFAPSLSMLLNTILKYEIGLRGFLSKECEIYYCSNTEKIFRVVIQRLAKEIGFKINEIPAMHSESKSNINRKKLDVDPNFRKNDLAPVFSNNHPLENLFSSLLHKIQKRKGEEKRVVFMPAGKHDEYFTLFKKGRETNGFKFIIPLQKTDIPKFFIQRPKNILFYYVSRQGPRGKNVEIDHIISSLKANLKRMVDFDFEVLSEVMSEFIFPHFYGAYNYYRSFLSLFENMQPDLVICSSEVSETHILAAQAANFKKIATSITFHGLSVSGIAEYKVGTTSIFDLCLAFGKKDVLDFIDQGVEESHIFVTSHPYFSRFLPLSFPVKTKKRYQKALILPYEFYGVIPNQKLAYNYRYLEELIQLLTSLDIELVGIKVREQTDLINLGIDKNYLEYNGRKIPVLTGYLSFPEAVKDVDIIVGQPTSAIIESNLLGKDYFVYFPNPIHETTPYMFKAVYDIVNPAYTIDELRNNILSMKPYREGFSVNDLIDLAGVKTKEDLFEKFENKIAELLHTPRKKQEKID